MQSYIQNSVFQRNIFLKDFSYFLRVHDRLETRIIARKHLLNFAYYGTFNVHPNTNDAWEFVVSDGHNVICFYFVYKRGTNELHVTSLNVSQCFLVHRLSKRAVHLQ